MESYGNILKTAREQKNIDIETAARETSIPGNYIIALEQEQLEKFPGEAYFMGFLRNYAAYLGLDHSYLYTLFRAKLIQTAPVPAELLKPRRPRFVLPLVIFGSLLVLGGLVFVGIRFINPLFQKSETVVTVVTKTTGNAVYRLTSEPLRKRVYVGDSLVIPGGGASEDIILDVSHTLGTFGIKTPAGEQFVELGEELPLDADGKGGVDIIIFLSDISATDMARGAEIRALLTTAAAVSVPVNTSAAPRQSAVTAIILEDTRAYPFTLRINFRDMCVFRYQADNQNRIEDLFSNGALVTIQANNGIRIWISNNNSARMQIIADGKSFDLEVDKTNQVAVRDIRWIRSAPNAYQLAVLEVD
jgi:cytoskeletal protein RodZ